MNAKLLILEGGKGIPQETAKKISDGLRQYFGVDLDCETCFRAKELLGGISEAFARADIVITAVESSEFCKTKLLLMRAMHLKTEINARLSQLLLSSDGGAENGASTTSDIASQCAVPVGASVFATRDGKFSGFAVKSGKQHFALIPADAALTGSQLEELYGYFRELGIEKLEPTAGAVVQATSEAAKHAHREHVAPTQSEATKAALTALEHNDLRVYFAKTAAAAAAENLCALYPDNSERAVFTDFFEKRESESPKNHTAALARGAIANEQNGMGAAISNIFSGTDGGRKKFFIYVALADSRQARVIKISSEEGETPDELLDIAAEKLFEMISDKCIVGLPSPDDIGGALYEPPEAPPETPEKMRRAGLWVLLWLLLALIITGIVFFIFKGVDNANAQRTNAATAFQAYAELDNEDYTFIEAASQLYNSAENATELGEDDSINPFGEVSPGEEDFHAAYLGLSEEETARDIALTTAVRAAENATTAAPITSPKKDTTDKTTAKKEDPTTKPASSTTTTKKPSTTSTTKKPVTTTKKPAAQTTTKSHGQIVADLLSSIGASVTTTKKPTTGSSTAVPTTVPSGSSQNGTVTPAAKGTLTFTVYGYGHGVGMSQDGAVAYAKLGWNAEKILLHYYPGTKLVVDPNPPATVTYGSKQIELIEYLCRTSAAEIGPTHTSASIEAVKAQMIAIYSYAKHYNFCVAADQHAYRESFNYTGTNIEAAAIEVAGKYLSYNDQAILATYCATSAGKTSSSVDTWGGKSYPYLAGGVDSSVDRSSPRWKTVVVYSAADVQQRAKTLYGINLTGDPSSWIKIISHDGAVSGSVGYVKSVSVGGKVMSGQKFRAEFMDYGIRSHCFTVSYSA